MSFVKKHDISAEKILEMIKPYYHGNQEKTTNELDRDTSYELSPEGRTTTAKQDFTILLILQPTEGGNKAKATALVDSGAMICCIDIDFTRRMKWPLKKLWRPTLARNADGSSNAGGLIRSKIWLTFQIDRRTLTQDFFATQLQ